jgi:hypothetical protein
VTGCSVILNDFKMSDISRALMPFDVVNCEELASELTRDSTVLSDNCSTALSPTPAVTPISVSAVLD